MSPEVAALEQAERELADVTRRLAALEPPGPRPPPWPKSEPVRTSFDDVYPGMPPAVKLSA